MSKCGEQLLIKKHYFLPGLSALSLVFLILIEPQGAIAIEKKGAPSAKTRLEEPSSLTENSRIQTLNQTPATLILESLKSTSSVVLTEKAFSNWWRQQQIDSEVVFSKTPGNTKAPGNFQEVSLKATPGSPLIASLEWVGYALKAGDIISIQLLGHPEFSQKNILIGPDNTITLPLIGKVMVGGSSPETLTNELNRRLAAYLRYPSATVTLEKIAPQRIYILGAVKKPGLHLLDGHDANAPTQVGGTTIAKSDYHLSTALIKAGGLLADADLAHVKVFNLRNLRCQDANIIELLAYGALPNDLALGAEDIVYVPRLAEEQWNHPEVLKLLANSNMGQDTYPVRVYGFVNRPDVYQLNPNEMTLQTVLAKSGIDIDRAQPKHIIIARTLPNQQMLALKVDGTRKDATLFPNDVVIVAKSNWKHLTKSVFGAASAVTMPLANLRYIIDTGNTVTP